MALEQPLGPLDEWISVEQWRRSCLRDAGVKPTAAQRLAVSDADLHDMLEAKHAGCTDGQLLRIFE